jgi:hypothetical protein
MTIRLRVAGIYYDEKFEIGALGNTLTVPGRVPPSGSPTILELLEAAFSSPGTNKENFIYVFERRGKALSMTSLGVTHKNELVGTLGNNNRRAGIYQLTEIAIPSGVVAWQYYVYRNGISVSQQPNSDSIMPVTGYSPAKGNGSGFTGFDQFVLEDGDEVIWRQVAILREPNQPNRS